MNREQMLATLTLLGWELWQWRGTTGATSFVLWHAPSQHAVHVYGKGIARLLWVLQVSDKEYKPGDWDKLNTRRLRAAMVTIAGIKDEP